MCGGGDAEIKETPEQKELAKIAKERWLEYQQFYVPAEEQYFEYVENVDSAPRMDQATGAAVANVESSFGQAVQQDVADLTTQGTGVNPASGQFQAVMADRADDKAVARTDNTTRTGQALQDASMAGKQNIVAMGNNQSGQAIAGLNDIAQQSAVDARADAQSDFTRSMGNQAALGMAAGAGYGVYKNTDQAVSNG